MRSTHVVKYLYNKYIYKYKLPGTVREKYFREEWWRSRKRRVQEKLEPFEDRPLEAGHADAAAAQVGGNLRQVLAVSEIGAPQTRVRENRTKRQGIPGISGTRLVFFNGYTHRPRFEIGGPNARINSTLPS